MASPYWFVWKTVQCVISFRPQYFICIVSFIFIFRFECGFLHCIFVFSTVFSKGSAGYFLSWIYFPHTHCEHEPCFVDTTCIDLKTCWFVCLIWMFSYIILFVRIYFLQEVWMFSLFQAMQKSCCLQNAHLNAAIKAKICLDAEVDS